jgi:hypothetical protein
MREPPVAHRPPGEVPRRSDAVVTTGKPARLASLGLAYQLSVVLTDDLIGEHDVVHVGSLIAPIC